MIPSTTIAEVSLDWTPWDYSPENVGDEEFWDARFWWSDGLFKVDWLKMVNLNLPFQMVDFDLQRFLNKISRFSINPMIPIAHMAVAPEAYDIPEPSKAGFLFSRFFRG